MRDVVVICGQHPHNHMPKPPNEPVSPMSLQLRDLSGRTVETIRICTNDVDGLWTPIHESNQRTNYY
jgi:hypothetical protein